MDQMESRLAALETKIDRLQRTTDRLYKFFLWAANIAVVSFVLPLIGLAFVIPTVISSYSAVLEL